MWAVSGTDLRMTEGDYGIELPVTISGTTLTASDSVKLTLKDTMNGTTKLEKVFTDISQNTFDLTLTAEESEGLPVGNYVYSLDWFQDGVFMCNIITAATFKVVDKA